MRYVGVFSPMLLEAQTISSSCFLLAGNDRLDSRERTKNRFKITLDDVVFDVLSFLASFSFFFLPRKTLVRNKSGLFVSLFGLDHAIWCLH